MNSHDKTAVKFNTTTTTCISEVTAQTHLQFEEGRKEWLTSKCAVYSKLLLQMAAETNKIIY